MSRNHEFAKFKLRFSEYVSVDNFFSKNDAYTIQLAGPRSAINYSRLCRNEYVHPLPPGAMPWAEDTSTYLALMGQPAWDRDDPYNALHYPIRAVSIPSENNWLTNPGPLAWLRLRVPEYHPM